MRMCQRRPLPRPLPPSSRFAATNLHPVLPSRLRPTPLLSPPHRRRSKAMCDRWRRCRAWKGRLCPWRGPRRQPWKPKKRRLGRSAATPDAARPRLRHPRPDARRHRDQASSSRRSPQRRSSGPIGTRWHRRRRCGRETILPSARRPAVRWRSISARSRCKCTSPRRRCRRALRRPSATMGSRPTATIFVPGDRRWRCSTARNRSAR